MPFQRPTLSDLVKQARTDIAESTGDFIILRSSPLGILAKAVAGLIQGLYGYLDWIARMAVPFTAEDEYLAAWAALVGIYPKDSADATGSIRFTGAPGSVLPDGSSVARTSDGLEYRTTALGTVGSGGTVTVPAIALAAGAAGNTLAGAQFVLNSPAPGVNADGLATTPFSGGADAEAPEDFRQRMLERYQAPPQGGAQADYVQWALEVPGVTRAWASANGAGAGTVVVYTMFDDARAGFLGFPQGTDGGATDETRTTPATGDQLTVADYIQPLRPVTALVYSAAPAKRSVNLTIADLSEDNAANRAAIVVALRGMFRRIASPGGTIYPSDLSGAIDSVPGVDRFTLVSPVAPIVPAAGALPILGAVTWA